MSNFCFVTDSLGLDAAVGQPEANSISYIKMLEMVFESKCGEEISITKDCLTGRTSKMVFNLRDKYRWDLFEKVFVQVGIVDCSPRVLTAFQRKLVGKIRPLFVRDRIIKLISRLHVRWFFKNFPYPILINKDSFKKNLAGFIEHAKSKSASEIYLISIAPTTDIKEYTYVGLSRNIIMYNDALKEIAKETGVKYIDFYNFIYNRRNDVVYDGVHLNQEGKKLLADFIYSSIK